MADFEQQVQSILSSSQADNATKGSAYEAFIKNPDLKGFVTSIKDLPLPDDTKFALFQAKQPLAGKDLYKQLQTEKMAANPPGITTKIPVPGLTQPKPQTPQENAEDVAKDAGSSALSGLKSGAVDLGRFTSNLYNSPLKYVPGTPMNTAAVVDAAGKAITGKDRRTEISGQLTDLKGQSDKDSQAHEGILNGIAAGVGRTLPDLIRYGSVQALPLPFPVKMALVDAITESDQGLGGALVGGAKGLAAGLGMWGGGKGADALIGAAMTKHPLLQETVRALIQGAGGASTGTALNAILGNPVSAKQFFQDTLTQAAVGALATHGGKGEAWIHNWINSKTQQGAPQGAPQAPQAVPVQATATQAPPQATVPPPLPVEAATPPPLPQQAVAPSLPVRVAPKPQQQQAKANTRFSVNPEGQTFDINNPPVSAEPVQPEQPKQVEAPRTLQQLPGATPQGAGTSELLSGISQDLPIDTSLLHVIQGLDNQSLLHARDLAAENYKHATDPGEKEAATKTLNTVNYLLFDKASKDKTLGNPVEHYNKFIRKNPPKPGATAQPYPYEINNPKIIDVKPISAETVIPKDSQPQEAAQVTEPKQAAVQPEATPPATPAQAEPVKQPEPVAAPVKTEAAQQPAAQSLPVKPAAKAAPKLEQPAPAQPKVTPEVAAGKEAVLKQASDIKSRIANTLEPATARGGKAVVRNSDGSVTTLNLGQGEEAFTHKDTIYIAKKAGNRVEIQNEDGTKIGQTDFNGSLGQSLADHLGADFGKTAAPPTIPVAAKGLESTLKVNPELTKTEEVKPTAEPPKGAPKVETQPTQKTAPAPTSKAPKEAKEAPGTEGNLPKESRGKPVILGGRGEDGAPKNAHNIYQDTASGDTKTVGYVESLGEGRFKVVHKGSSKEISVPGTENWGGKVGSVTEGNKAFSDLQDAVRDTIQPKGVKKKLVQSLRVW